MCLGREGLSGPPGAHPQNLITLKNPVLASLPWDQDFKAAGGGQRAQPRASQPVFQSLTRPGLQFLKFPPMYLPVQY